MRFFRLAGGGAAVALLACAWSRALLTAAPPIDVTGTWTGTGSDTFGVQTLTWELTQSGTAVTGQVVMNAVNPNDGSCASCHRNNKVGSLSGTISGTTLTLTMLFLPGRAGDPTPICQMQFNSPAASIIGGVITGAYSQTDTCEPNATGTLTMQQVTSLPSIATPPSDQTVTAGASATFSSEAGGTPSPTVRWQVSPNGGSSFSDIAGATNGTYSFVTSASDNGKLFRAVFTNTTGTAISNAATLTVLVNGPSDARIALDAPANGARLAPSFTVAGWAVDRGAAMGTGVDAIHVYAFPIVDDALGAPIFAGAAVYGNARSDVGGAFGGQFTNAGFALGVTLQPGTYRLSAYAHSSVTGTFKTRQVADVTITPLVSRPAMALDQPANGATQGPSFTISGWAVDRGASSDSGVDAVHVYANPIVDGALGAPLFVGAAAYGGARDDVGAVFGTQFTNSAFRLSATLPLGTYRVIVSARSTVTGTFNDSQWADVTIASRPRMALDGPTNNATVMLPFITGGWAADLAAPSGTGVDAVHIWAFPTGGGPARFVDAAALGGGRPDVGAVFGGQFEHSGYTFLMTSLAPGTYDIGVFARSTITGTFNQQRFARVTVAASSAGSVPLSAAVGLNEPLASYAPIIDPSVTDSAIDLSIDVPQAGSLNSGPLVVAGRAIDREAGTESGIGGIHVWAVRPGQPPVFLGVAEADLASAGWQLVGPVLAPGEYDLLVYAWSVRTRQFEAVRVVRVAMQ